MKLTYEQIKNKPKVHQSVTSLRRDEFEKLSEFFDNRWQAYIQHYTLEGKVRDRRITIRRNTVLRTAEDRLLFILYHLKGNVLQELMAITFEMTQPQVSIWIKLLSKLLREALDKQGFLPVRKVDQLKKALEKETTVIIDRVERKIQRPKDPEVQKEYYSGKKSIILSRTI
jgi:predicted DNA binding CopG/RHH family protein